MRYIRFFAALLAALLLQNAATNAAQSTLRSKASREINDRLQSALSSLPTPVRLDSESLLNTGDEAEERRLIEKLGDSDSDAIRDVFVDRVVREPLASVRLELLEYLIRNPRPDLRDVFERLAKSDPDPDVAIAALEGVRAVEVQKVREILTQRLDQSRSSNTAFKTFAEADERWISLVRGTMLPGFLRVSPPAFTTKQQNNIRVVAFGDFGTGTDEQKQVAAAMMAEHRKSPFDIGVTVGDNFYPVGMESLKDPRWKTWWEDLYGPMQIVFYAVLGNHDWYDFDSPAAEILYSGHARSWEMPAPYYTFVAGPVQFFAIDTNEVSAKQLVWLDEELKKSRARWKVVYGHHPIYSDGYHGDNARLVDKLLPVLKNRVDVYLSGHEHDLQHLKPEGGIHFLVSGGGGRDLRTPQPTSRALFATEKHGFTILQADQTKFDIRFVGADSQTINQYTIRK